MSTDANSYATIKLHTHILQPLSKNYETGPEVAFLKARPVPRMPDGPNKPNIYHEGV